jgi:hypothetical protein
MNNKVKLAIAVAVGIVGGGLIGTFGGTKPSGVISASVASEMEFPEWTRNGSAFRCKDGKVQGCIGGTSCGTAGRTGTTQPVAVCQKCEMWIDMDDLLTNKPDYDTNMLLQVDPNYGPKE